MLSRNQTIKYFEMYYTGEAYVASVERWLETSSLKILFPSYILILAMASLLDYLIYSTGPSRIFLITFIIAILILFVAPHMYPRYLRKYQKKKNRDRRSFDADMLAFKMSGNALEVDEEFEVSAVEKRYVVKYDIKVIVLTCTSARDGGTREMFLPPYHEPMKLGSYHVYGIGPYISYLSKITI